jgi:DNA-binding CsgD family transcriptional regulator
MPLKDIQKVYSEIFKSYGNPTLEEHIRKIIEFDVYLPHNSTFFCITNTQDLSFEYISNNMEYCLAIEKSKLKKNGMRYFWNRIHPDDQEHWLTALKELMNFTIKEISVEDRHNMSYTWNFRFKNGNGEYINVIQNTTPLQYDESHKPIIGLAHYTIVDPNIKMEVCASAKMLNGNNTYETKYFNNFSRKLLSLGISNRERDIVRLLILNYTSKQISKKLNISVYTVSTHRRNILKKLNISTTGELVGMLRMDKNII